MLVRESNSPESCHSPDSLATHSPQSNSSQIEPFPTTLPTPPHSLGSSNITNTSLTDKEENACASTEQTQVDDASTSLLSSKVIPPENQVQRENFDEYFAKEDLAYPAHDHFQGGSGGFENPNHSSLDQRSNSSGSENYYCSEERSSTYVQDFHSFTTPNGDNREELSETRSTDPLHYLLNENNGNCFDTSSSSVRSDFEQGAYIFHNEHNRISSEWHSDIVTRGSEVSNSIKHEISNVNSTRNNLYGKDQAPILPRPIPTTTSYGAIDTYLSNNEDGQNFGRRSLYSESMFQSWQQTQLRPAQSEASDYHQQDTLTSLNQQSNSKFEEVCDDVEECTDETSNQTSFPLGIKTTISPLSSFPSFMEPSRPNIQHLTCCDDPCCKETCGYDNHSWNTNDNSNYATLVQYQPPPLVEHVKSRTDVPVIRWNENLTNQENLSLPQISSNNIYIHAQSHKRAIQDDFFANIPYEESNTSSYLLPTTSNIRKKSTNDIFRKHMTNNDPTSIIVSEDGDSDDMLMSMTPSVGFARQDAIIQVQEKYEPYQLQPKIDLNDNIPETPEPPFDLNDQRPDSRPRRQKLKYPGDMYTPQWVRYAGHSKEGYCDNCKPGKWLQLKNSAYWYHKQFYHGISSVSGKRFVPPLETRTFETGDCTEGLCHQCSQWVPISTSKKKNSMLWFRHAHKCHVYVKPKNYAPSGKRR